MAKPELDFTKPVRIVDAFPGAKAVCLQQGAAYFHVPTPWDEWPPAYTAVSADVAREAAELTNREFLLMHDTLKALEAAGVPIQPRYQTD